MSMLPHDFGEAARRHVPQAMAEALERRFGLGTRPDLRRQLYDRLEKLHDEAGDDRTRERIYQQVASAAADAAGKGDPGRYFAMVVMARLRERGCLPALSI